MAFAYRGTARHLASLWALPPLYDRAVSTTFVREVTMAFDAARSEIFDRLEERLRVVPAAGVPASAAHGGNRAGSHFGDPACAAGA